MTAKAKVIIAGGSGYIGNFLVKQFRPLYSVSTIDRTSGYDIINGYTSIRTLFERLKPAVVIHCINYGNIRECELNKEDAYKVNVLGTKTIVKLCKKYKSYMIYLSTDYVFDGRKGNYTEDDTANPINYFGQTKLMVEKLILLEYPNNSLIVRTGGVYGYRGRKNSNLDLWLIEKLKNKEIINVFSDIYNTPTYIGDISEALIRCIKHIIVGLYHLCGPQRISRYDLVKSMATFLGYDGNIIQPVISNSFELVDRPKDVSLVSKALENRLKISFSSVHDGLMKSSY